MCVALVWLMGLWCPDVKWHFETDNFTIMCMQAVSRSCWQGWVSLGGLVGINPQSVDWHSIAS